MRLGKSSADDTWTPAKNGRMVIAGSSGVGGIVFGAPMLGFGLYFLYKYLVLGIIEYVKVGDIAGLFSGIFGWLVVILIGSIFAVPGWLLVFMRRRVVVDTVSGKVEDMKDFLLFKRGKVHRLADFGSVQVVATRDNKSFLQEVRLISRGKGDHLVAGILFDGEAARRLGQELAALLRLPCATGTETEEDDEEEKES